MTNTENNNDRKKYVLQVQRGEELSLRRPEEICNEESIMRPSYEKAMRALMRIMLQTKRFHNDNNNKCRSLDVYALENRLFSYSGNIIAFAASRGGGKTATMLSFSQILKKGFKKRCAKPFPATELEYIVDNSFLNDLGCCNEDPERWMERCCFIPLTPIAPAVLEGDQNILYVVLSRLYRYAERLITECGRVDRIEEAQKNKIIRSFQKVLSGINGIKGKQTHPADLAGMQDICDGMSLSRHFYELVQNILEMAAGDKGNSDRYLVIQLDDADSKMQMVHEVMEDVRKYLMIPNLVILMSVDQKCLSDVVFQDNLSCFSYLIDIDKDRLSRDLSRIANKYIDKLIPPTHMVQLPQLDQVVIHWGDMLRLRYVDESGENVYDWMNDENLDLQTAILVLIYRKTGILFVKPPHYLHNLIPRTLRGFVQLLSFLDSMQNIPVLHAKQFANAKVYAEAILTRSKISALNQRRFAEYFKSSWLNVKITDLEDLDFLRKFADTVSTNRVRLAVKHLCKRYGESFEGNKPEYFRDKDLEIKDIRNLEDLDQLMWVIEETHRTEKDFRLVFAIRTLLTLDSHQHILKIMRDSARVFLKNPEDYKYLTFNLSPDDIWVPKTLWLEEVGKQYRQDNPNGQSEAKDRTRQCNCLADVKTQEKNAQINKEIDEFTLCDKAFARLLILGEKEVMSLLRDDDQTERLFLYQIQDLAVMLFANRDVSYAVRRYLNNYMNIPENSNDMRENVIVIKLTKLINAIWNQIDGFNDGYVKVRIADPEDIITRDITEGTKNLLLQLFKSPQDKTHDPLNTDTGHSTPGDSVEQQNASDDRNEKTEF